MLRPGTNIPVNFEESEAAQTNIFFQQIMSKFFGLWKWLIFSVLLCAGLSFVYIKIAKRQYKIHASVLVQDDKKNSDYTGANVVPDVTFVTKGNVDNEAEVFKSRTLMQDVVEQMHLNIQYFIPGMLWKEEIFLGRPVLMNYITRLPDTIVAPIIYKFNLDTLNLTHYSLAANDTTYKSKLGDTLVLPEGKVVFTASEGFAKWPASQTLVLSIISEDLATQNYMDALTVETPNKDVSVIDLTLNETLPGKGETILHNLLKGYLDASIHAKTVIADSTLKFLDGRLRLVFGELSGIERNIEDFKTFNKFTDLTMQSNLLMQNTSEYAKQQTGQEIQLSVVEALEQFLEDNKNDLRIVPSSLVMQDAGFIALVQRYNEMQLNRDKLLMSVTPEHPSVKTIDEQLRNLKTELLSSIRSVKQGLSVGVGELKKHTSGFEQEFNKMPGKERTFLDFSRQQSIKQELYLYLLKKREETAVSRASTTASARIIDEAKSEPLASKPKKLLIMLIGCVLGVAFPFGISYARDFLNTRVSSAEDIAGLTAVPVLAEISHSTEPGIIAVTMHSRQLAAEHLRGLRTNLQYLLTGKDEKSILITSSMSGEGKSFLSINLCLTLALAGKKIILLELDLRNPKISAALELSKEGFTNYIIAPEADWKKWVKPSGIQDNFDVLSSGLLPPNPTELLMSPKMAVLMKELKKSYDYIIIDTPPAGMVTDAEIIAPFADTTFYVVRQKHTYKEQLQLVEKFSRKGTLPRLNIILNDMALRKKRYGRPYEYGYGYGQEKKKRFSGLKAKTARLFQFVKRTPFKTNKSAT